MVRLFHPSALLTASSLLLWSSPIPAAHAVSDSTDGTEDADVDNVNNVNVSVYRIMRNSYRLIDEDIDGEEEEEDAEAEEAEAEEDDDDFGDDVMCSFANPTVHLARNYYLGGHEGESFVEGIRRAQSMNDAFFALVEEWYDDEATAREIFEEGTKPQMIKLLMKVAEGGEGEKENENIKKDDICSLARALIQQMDGTCKYKKNVSAYVTTAANFMHGISSSSSNQQMGGGQHGPVNILKCTYEMNESDNGMSDKENVAYSRNLNSNGVGGAVVTFEQLYGKYLDKETFEMFSVYDSVDSDSVISLEGTMVDESKVKSK